MSLARLMFCLPLLLAACTQPEASRSGGINYTPPNYHRVVPNPNATPSPFVRGTAVVVSVDQTAGHVALDIQGRRVNAYWQTETVAPQVYEVDKVPTYTGDNVNSSPRSQTLDAQPGDTIAYVGMQTGNSIFLQTVTVLKRP